MINKRILALINMECAGNKRAFAQKVGVSPSVIENIAGKRQGKPGFEVMEKILNAFENVNARWLITGKGEMYHEMEPLNEELITAYKNISHAIEVLSISNEKIADGTANISEANKILAISNSELVNRLSVLMDDIANIRVNAKGTYPENKGSSIKASENKAGYKG